jgi:predicted ArsR family transcriptional regulator
MLKKIALESQLSIDTVSKVVVFAEKKGHFTADDLAYALNVTPRHVRNIINLFLNLSYLSTVGEERPYPRGRPRRIYSLQLERKIV